MKKIFLVLSVVFFFNCTGDSNEFQDEQMTVTNSKEARKVNGEYHFKGRMLSFYNWNGRKMTFDMSDGTRRRYSTRQWPRGLFTVTVSGLGTMNYRRMRRLSM